MIPTIIRRTLAATAASVLILFGCSVYSSENDPESVSLIELIAHGSKYVGRRVVVSGYLADKINFYLFVTIDHAAISDYESSISISETDDGDILLFNCANAYVSVVGKIVEPFEKGEFGMVYVEAIFDHDSKKMCWKKE